jgi:hypothetical protein
MCVFFGQGCIILKYLEDCIVVGDSISCIDTLIQSLHDGTEKRILQDEGSVDKYLGVSITQLINLSFSLTQPFFIDCVAAFLGIDNGCTNKCLKPAGKPLLNNDLMEVSQKNSWEYHGTIGMLTYLTGSVWPDIAMAMHQCAFFQHQSYAIT